MTSVNALNALGAALTRNLIASFDELRRWVDDAPDEKTKGARVKLYNEAMREVLDLLIDETRRKIADAEAQREIE